MRKGDVVSYISVLGKPVYASFASKDNYRLLFKAGHIKLQTPKCIAAPRELFRNERIGT